MKSFVYEGKSLNDAIEKAWIVASRPDIFSIKILSKGIESMLWWKRTSWKIAFFYEITLEKTKQKSFDERIKPFHREESASAEGRRSFERTKEGGSRQRTKSSHISEQLNTQEKNNNFQHSTEQRSNESRSMDPRSNEPRSHERSRELRSNEPRSNEQRLNEQRSNEPRSTEQRSNEQRTPSHRFQESRPNEQRSNEQRYESSRSIELPSGEASSMEPRVKERAKKIDEHTIVPLALDKNSTLKKTKLFVPEWVNFSEQWISDICQALSLSYSAVNSTLDAQKKTLTISVHFSPHNNSVFYQGIGYSLSVLLQEAMKKKFAEFDNRIHRIIINDHVESL